MKTKLFKIMNQTNRGQSILIFVIFFLTISGTLLFGLVKPMVTQIRVESNQYNSRASYFLAEAGAEDVLYRLKNNISVSPTEILTLNSNTVNTTMADTLTGKTITADAEVRDLERKIELQVISGVGASFNYGVQVGNGGFVFYNNAGVNGNVYSNGNITGSNGAFITGTAIAANTIALTADQTNDSPSTPSDSIAFGTTTSKQDMAQSFKVSTTTNLNKVDLYIKKVSTPSNATVRIVTDNSGSPSTNNLTTGTLSASAVGTSYGWVTVTFTSNPQLVAGTTYWFVIDGGVNSTKYYILGANTSYGNGTAKIGQYGSTWNNTQPAGLDGYFRVYLGGLTSTISNITVGSSTGAVGDARANTVNSVTVYGNLYCQTGSGNNKACDTSQSDPVPTTFPVSEANISQWKDEATEGGVHSGDLIIDSVSTSTGPLEITGNLLVVNNSNITITGTVWVHGNITFDNNVTISLDSEYGANSGVILSDGRIDITNNSVFADSGTPGSYILVITTSDCPTSSSCVGANAISVGNNAGTVILNAQNGTLSFSNNTGAKQATARTILLQNNAIVTYETGLADVNFSSGPGGAWNITSWKEIQ